ncbi:unknown [Bacteroides sp. CAG:875]|jgi:hypothetical protein|nr:unknown [Bacteroides sp. CAG:875]
MAFTSHAFLFSQLKPPYYFDKKLFFATFANTQQKYYA